MQQLTSTLFGKTSTIRINEACVGASAGGHLEPRFPGLQMDCELAEK